MSERKVTLKYLRSMTKKIIQFHHCVFPPRSKNFYVSNLLISVIVYETTKRTYVV